MHLDNVLTDNAVLAEIGRRTAEHRVARGLTQSEFAERAGVTRSTIQRVESGGSIQLTSFVKILRALNRVDALDNVLTPEVRSPLAELERARSRRQRVRHAPTAATPEDDAPWVWGNQGGES